MKVRDIMSPGVQTAQPDDTVQDVAEAMAGQDIGSMPVCDGRRMVGMVTDRDIALRVVAKGLPPSTVVAHAMTRHVEFCGADDDIDDAAEKMARLKVRRLPVVDEASRLVGVLALGDLARESKAKRVGETLGDISEPGTH